MQKASASAPPPSRRVPRTLSTRPIGFGCQGLKRIFGPSVLRIAPAQLLANLGIAAAPESLQVARDLYRPSRRRQQHQRDRDRAATDSGRLPDAEGILESQREARRLGIRIVHTASPPARQQQPL